MKEFKIRASASGKIMGQKGLGKTGESYCQEWLTEQVYGRKREFTNKYIQKGLQNEDNSLDFIAENMGFGLLVKNEQYYENDFITGTPDIVLSDLIIDVKNSWDCFTFPAFDSELPNKDYYYQMQCYMSLTGKDNAKVIYVLSDTPEHLIESEARKLAFVNGNELNAEFIDSVRAKMTYFDIEAKYRIKSFDIARNNEVIELINQRVIQCREYIETLLK